MGTNMGPPTKILITKISKKSGKLDQSREVGSLVGSVTHRIGMASYLRGKARLQFSHIVQVTILILDPDTDH